MNNEYGGRIVRAIWLLWAREQPDIINDKRQREQGYAASTRWWCTREDIKNDCRQAARNMIRKWADAEAATAQRMGAL